jgi:hypothetical protein
VPILIPWSPTSVAKREMATVFIARPEAAPASTTSGRAAPVVERPLTRDVIIALLGRFPQA